MNSIAKFERALDSTVAYLNSEEALAALREDAYWPKWHAPWWHMLLLYEMGEVARIPAKTMHAYVERVQAIPLKSFPLRLEDLPAGVDPYRGTPCHCQLGNVYQTLSAWGVDVDLELPWIRPWFLKYQMADGGLNCDNDAYLVKDEVPSSMVGTIAVFESLLLGVKTPYTPEEKASLDKGAAFLMSRKLIHGSETKHNASERESAPNWLKPCFPRYYLYDVLRGLRALTLWAERTGGVLPAETVREAASYLKQHFPNGEIRNERHSYEGAGTLLLSANKEWLRRQPATFFPLLEQVSRIGDVSPFLSRQWAQVQESLQRLKITY